MFVDDAPALSVAELAARVKRLHAREGVQLVIVDYVQLLSGGRRFENRVQELGHISRSLKALAKELDIAIIAVAQLNREYAKRQNQKPTSADLEGSSQWEKDASTVVFIYRDNDPMVAEKDVNSANIIVDRSRNGSSGEFVVGWHGKTTQFTDEPMPLDSSDAAAYRKELALKCQALPLTWDSWLLHESGYDEVLKQARQAYAGMKDGVREAVKPLLQSWSNGHVDREAFKRLQQVRNGDLLLAAIASISARKILLEDVRNWVVPALLDKNFAVFHGPSGRGKTQMARIIQSMVIAECGMPAVWLNWRKFTRQVKDTFNGNGTEHEVWRQSRAPVLILDDPDKVILNEWNTGQLYDVLDEAGNINGTPRWRAAGAQPHAQGVHERAGCAGLYRRGCSAAGLSAQQADRGGLQHCADLGAQRASVLDGCSILVTTRRKDADHGMALPTTQMRSVWVHVAGYRGQLLRNSRP